jgi:hypothetical protein
MLTEAQEGNYVQVDVDVLRIVETRAKDTTGIRLPETRR